MTDTLIHLDGIRSLADRAAIAQGLDQEGPLNYEKLGLCTPDLVTAATQYGQNVLASCLTKGLGLEQTLVYQFLCGFDIGYQAALEVYNRQHAEATVPDAPPAE